MSFKELSTASLEEALRESETKFKALTESAPIGIFLYTEKFIYVNPAMERLTGYRAKELYNLYVWDILHKDFRDTVRQRVKSRLRGQEAPTHYEVKAVTKEGHEKWLEISAATFEIRGKHIGIGTAVDITTRKQLEISLQEIVTKYQTILESFEGYVIVIADDYKIKFMNRKLFELKGWDALQQPCYQVFHSLEEPCPWCPLPKIRSGHKVHSEFQAPKSGKWYQIVASPLKLPSGELQMLVLAVDITDRKRAEEEALRASKLEALGLLAGGIAHDFNNFLTSILGNISLAKLKLKNHQDIKRLLCLAEEGCVKAKELTYQLLTFAKGGPPVKKPSSAIEIIKDTVSFCLRGSNVKWDLDFEEDLWLVKLDPTQFSQVLTNLVINAKQAMPQGGTLRILARNYEIKNWLPGFPLEPGKYIEIVVQDEGEGIPEEYLPKIFDPYFTTKKEGTGLGLAITYAIIKKQGGHIRVESEVGRGTTFFVYLPAWAGQSETDSPQEEEIYLGKGRILIMDDEEMIRETLQEALEYMGYEVITTCDGKQALEEFKNALERQEPFDLVILDLTVPGGWGGRRTLKEMRRLNPNVKAILASGYADDPAFHDARPYGFVAALRKPFTIQELSRVLQKVLHQDH